MPKPREINKNTIRQMESSNDKTLGLTMELLTRLNVKSIPVEELYTTMLENPTELDNMPYADIIKPLLVCIYYSEQLDDAIKTVRQQI